MKLYNFGSMNIDHVYEVDAHVKTGETVSACGYNVFIGGKGLNQSIAVARAGGCVSHVGALGCDGVLLKQALIDAGVDIQHLIETDTPTGHAIIQVNSDGDNCIIIYGGANQEINNTHIDRVFEQIREEDIILLQNEISNVDYIIEQAFKRGIRVMLNFSPVTNDLAKVNLNHITYLCVNEIEAKQIAGRDSMILESLLDNYPNLHIIMTLGEKGVLYASHRDGIISQPAYHVEVVDTTGAGDTFTGYFVASIMDNRDIQSALALSCKASAIAIGKMGASNAIPFIEEVLAYEII